ncbi:hypothetical protein [Comamonas endophytica]|uniref:hypothetical protein n=1 Tax=Comamonas endophytica TaxID=2949090 RepID=UPI001E2B3C5A|nr:hypothetical protein [Acidovorax sp. D4N7]MCD2511652.1 hypothetical protein [Acidovorax sp. D4N7]
MITNEFLIDARFRSCYIEGELICYFLVIFLKISKSGWIAISIGEGTANFHPLKEDPKLLRLSEIKDDYAYPISQLDQISFYFNKKITSIYEYQINGISEGCVGIYIEFENCGFSIIEEEEDCPSITHGIKDLTNENVSLCKISPRPTPWPKSY